MMSALAPVASGGLVASLQSAGVLGLCVGTKASVGAAGAVVGGAAGGGAAHIASQDEPVAAGGVGGALEGKELLPLLL